MFTWIVTHSGVIESIDDGHFTIINPFEEEVHIGQSIAHDGACMSVTKIEDTSYTFFAMQESLDKTNFGKKSVWDSFNLELCMSPTAKIDGHFVTWHIDTTWVLSKKEEWDDGSCLLGFFYDAQFSKYVIPKWSVSINGVSLTVVDADPGYISVRLIPLTQEVTNLGSLSTWDIVNLEFDMLWKYVVHHMENKQD